MFSIIMPMDPNRLTQFANTKRAYDKMPQNKEFLIPTRNGTKIQEYLEEHDLAKNVRILPYKHERGFNPSMAFNIGVRAAKYDYIIITSPEVMPISNVLEQFKQSLGHNIICSVDDEDENGSRVPLVGNGYRDETPAMYFLALFNKSDIEQINGWDEDFMRGYAYEDNDFGARWVRAGLPFVFREDIKAVHQFHPRSETIRGGASINFTHYNENNDNGVTYCTNGLKK